MDYSKFFKDKVILITGGTGSFGNRILKRLEPYGPKEIRIFSRDEKKQHEMKSVYKHMKNITFFIGNVRDKERIKEIIKDVDIVYHAAALKHVGSSEYSPEEAIKTNIIGAKNLIDCAIEEGVEKFIAISTDKAVKPVNVMGMTKGLQERLMISANNSQKNGKTKISCVRYGNVMSSRGSIIPYFKDLIKNEKPVTITDENMTRFMLTLDDAIDLVFYATRNMKGGEIFVKKAPSIKILDMAKILYKQRHGTGEGFKYEIIGRILGEKIHEILISEEEISRSMDQGEFFVITQKRIDSSLTKEYSSKEVLTNEDEIISLVKQADEVASEEYYNKIGS